MDETMFLLALSLVLPCIMLLIFMANQRKSSTTKFPPGPPPLPIIGNVFQVGNNPHRSLTKLARTYGPLMSLKLGSIPTIIISSPELAKQVLKIYDPQLSYRSVPDTIRACDHNKFSLAWSWSSATQQWRNLRKICTVLMFSVERLNTSQDLRRQKVQELMELVQESCSKGEAIDIGRAGFTVFLNLLSNTFFSIDIADYRLNSSREFKDLIWRITGLTAKPNISDFFPVFKFLDLQGLRRKASIEMKYILDIFDDIIKKRMELRASGTPTTDNDVLDGLLNLTTEKNNNQFGFKDIRHLLLDLFVAGADPTSSTLEWAMAELLHNPEKMTKVRTELQQVIGKDAVIQESDISRLPYLQAVLKEILRLHPPTPLLLPHEAEMEVEIDNFTVPKGARVIVNVWAFSRDPMIWPNPDSFEPERFLERETDVRGQVFDYIPFGAGRRTCPGRPLAHRMLHLMLASLLHSYDWKLPNGLKPKDMDMSDMMGMTVQIVTPLEAIPIKA